MCVCVFLTRAIFENLRFFVFSYPTEIRSMSFFVVVVDLDKRNIKSDKSSFVSSM